MLEKSQNWSKLSAALVSESDIQVAFQLAIASMTHLNKVAAELMHKYNAHAATDVTGFGLFGHARNLVEFQSAAVDFEIHTLPIIKHVHRMAVILQQNRLLTGRGVETSGGLLISLPAENSKDFLRDFRKNTGRTAWIIGQVVNGSRQVNIAETPTFLEAE